MLNDPTQQLIVDFLKAGGAELLTDHELNIALVVFDDEDDDVADDNDVLRENNDASIERIKARIRALRGASA